MDDKPIDQPITEYHITTVQSLEPYLRDSSRIAKALAQWPAIIEDAIPAIYAAQASPRLPVSPGAFTPVSPASFEPRIQLLRSFFPRREFWELSGYAKSQLDQIRMAFMDAFVEHETRVRLGEAHRIEANHLIHLDRKLKNRLPKNRWN